MRPEGVASFFGHCLHSPFKESRTSDVARYLQPTREKSTQWELPLAAQALSHTTTWSITFKQFIIAAVTMCGTTMATITVWRTTPHSWFQACLSGNRSSHYYFESCQKTRMRCLRCFTMRNIRGALESSRDGMAYLPTVNVTRGTLEEEMSDHSGFIWQIKMLQVTVNSDTNLYAVEHFISDLCIIF